MKRLVVVWVAVLALGLWGCTLADLLNLAGAPARECPDPGSKGTLTAKVAGTDFESCTTTISGAPNSSYVLHGLSGEAVPSEILITVVAPEGPGTYAFGGASGNGDTTAVYIDASEMLDGDESQGSYVTADEVESGSITFTTLDGSQAAGSFAFTGTRKSDGTTTREVTEGAFDVSF